MPADEVTLQELAELVPLVEARCPAVRLAVRRSGAAVSVRVSASEARLTEIEDRYLIRRPAGGGDPGQ